MIRQQVGKMIFQKSDKVLECEGNSGEFVELVPQQLNYLGPKDLTQYFIRSTHCHTWKSLLRFGDNFPS